MLNEKGTLGVTLARGGSKGIPRKNLQMLGGKPLIQWATDAMTQSKFLDDYIVSTEDDEITSVCRSLGVKVHRRHQDLSRDETTSAEVLLNIAEEYPCSTIIECMCTAPFTTTHDIDTFVEAMTWHEAEHAVSVVEVEHYHPSRLKYIGDDKLLPFFPEAIETRRQDLKPTAYICNGALYGMNVEALKRTGSKWGLAPYPFIMPKERQVNIDTPRDLAYARWLLENENPISSNRS